MHYFKSQKLRIVILLGFLLSCLTSVAQTPVPPGFAPRLAGGNIKIKGDVVFVGNNILNRTPTGTGYSGNSDNNSLTMEYIDIDSDASTFSSSSADLSLTGTCNRIAYAGLYWASTYPYERSTDSGSEWNPSDATRHSDFNQVKFKVPGGAYVDVIADNAADAVGEDDAIIFDGKSTGALNQSFKDAPIICYKNVTAIVQALTNPNGTYTLANLRAAKGQRSGASSAGWVLVVIYENPTMPGKFISTFDGYAGVSNTSTSNISINGFVTLPAPFAVRARLGVGALEGDKGITNDKLQIKANGVAAFTDVGNTLNPTTNFFNSTITNNDAQVTNRNPYGTNTLGLDLDMLTLSNASNSVIPNNETGATLKLTTSGDGYGAFLATFAVEIIEPDISLVKTVENPAGQNIAGQDVNLSDVLDYVVTFDNEGNDDAQNLVITDILPVNTHFQSVDLSNVPGATYIYNAATGTITFTIPNNLVLKGTNSSPHEIRIRVQVASSCNDLTDHCANIIQNSAFATYSGIENTAVINNDPSVAGIGACGAPITGPANFLVDVDNCIYTRTEILCGPSLILTAGDGYIAYDWYMENGATDIPMGTTQSITVTAPGQYYVLNTPVAPCVGLTENVTVNLSSTVPPNPIIPFADETAICPNNGIVMSNIFLCGINAQKIISTGVVAGTATWYKLDTVACNTVLPANCPHNGCPEANWVSIATGPNYTATTAGEYRLVINNSGCSATYYFNVYKNNLDPQVEVQNIVCTTPGEIKVVNVPAGYEYTLINQTTNTTLVPYGSTSIFPIATAGVYKVILRQVGVPNGCEFVLQNIGVMNKTMTVNITPTDKTCTVPGSINIQALGVDPQYTFTITGPGGVNITHGPAVSNNHNFTGLNPGTYTVTVTTQDGCTNTSPVTILDASQLSLTAVVSQHISCSQGNIQMNGSGGKTPYSYAIYSYNGVLQNPTPADYQTSVIFDIPIGMQGDYVFIMTDNNNCTTLSNLVTINLIPDVVFTTTVQNVLCNGQNNGSITLNVTNTNGYNVSFDLLNSGGTVIATNPSGVFTGLAPGTYTVVLHQTKGNRSCDFTFPYTITQPTAITAGAPTLTQAYTCTTTGTISINPASVTGGTAPYTYSIDGTTFGAATTFTGLTAGTYTVRIKDASGCVLNAVSVTIPALTPPTDLSFAATPISCSAATSTVTLTTTGGSGALTYQMTAPSTVNNGASAVFAGLAPGTYTFRVTDAKGCTYQENYTINSITPISVIGQNINNVICFGAANGALRYTVSGFGANFNYTVASTGTAIAPVTGATAGVINLTNLLAGTYTITVTDPVTGCTATATVTIQSPAAALAMTKTVTQPTCTTPTGTVIIAATGGWGSNTYALSGAATVGPQGSSTFTGLAAGNYTITVTDVNGCIVTDTFTIDTVIPPVLTVTGASDLCFDANGASITVAVTGGTGTAPFQYSKDGTNYQTSPVFTGLAPGTYTITVRDAKNCTTTVTRTISPQLTAVSVLTKGLDCSGSPNAQITVTINGGATPYSYEVKVGAAAYGASIPLVGNVINYSAAAANTYQFRITDATGCIVQTGTTTVAPITPPQFALTPSLILCYGASTGTIAVNINTAFGAAPYTIAVTNTDTSTAYGTQTTGLPAGNYSVRVTDKNGCFTVHTTTITQNTAIAYSFLKTDISCNNPGTISYGEITVGNGGGVTGGTAPYTYSVSNNFGDILTPVVSPTGAAHTFIIVNYGIYTIVVTDANGCSLTTNNIVIASPPDDLDIIVSSTADCTNGGTVTIEVDAIVGSGTYKFAVLTQSNHPFVSNPVTDYKDPDLGTPTIATFTGLIPGVVYTFVVWDTTTGCYFFEQAATAIATNSTINAAPIIPQNVTCFNEGDGNVSFTFGGYSPTTTQVSYEIYKSPSNISTGITDVVATTGISTLVNSIPGDLTPGDYIIVFTEIDGTVAGCSKASASFTISQSATMLVASAVVTKNDNCNPAAGIITASAQFGTAPYQYQLELATDPAPTAATWAGGISPVLPADGGNYIVYVKDANNCIKDFPITLPTDVSPEITATLDAQCNTAEGTYTINVARTINGSLAPFTYSLNGGIFESQPDTFSYTDLTSGIYSIRIQDVNGCIYTLPTNITIYSPLSVTANPTVQPSCTDDDGEITAAGLGGSASANYLYELRDLTAVSVVLPQQASPVFTGLAAGTYTVRLYDTATTCTVDAAVTLDAAIPVTFTTAKDDVNCFGGNDGSIIITLGAGNTDIPYTYVIDGALSLPITQSDPTFTDLVADTYTVTVTSGKGCSTPATVTITEPLQLAVTTTATPFACTTGNTINTSVVTVTATIGTGTTPYMYSIDGINYSTTNTFQIINDGTTTHNITGYVRDANGCEATEGEVILPLVSLSATAILTTAIECDDNIGVITVTATGGSGNYAFTMLPSGTPLTPGTATQTFAITEPGIYTFEVEDTTTGCIYTVSAAEIFEYDLIDVIATASTPVNCFGSATGTITIDVQNYTGAYNYEVFDGATSVTTGTGNTTTNPFTIPNVTAGNLFVTVTATGTPFCSADTAIIAVDSPADPLLPNAVATANVTCTNDKGEIVAQATGGWGGYEYELINTTTATTVQAYDPNNVFTGLPEGNYTVNVRDSSNCIATQTNITLVRPPFITASINASATAVLCNGDDTVTITATGVTGGQGTYQYVLNMYDATGTTIVNSTGAQTSPAFTGLGVGIYSITVSDGWDCELPATATVTITEPAPLVGTLSMTKSLTCLTQAELTISATGGTAPYTYSTDNVTYTSTTVYPVGSGTYTYYVRDNNGCAAVLTNSVEVPAVPALNLNLDLDAAQINCNGGSNAVITADATGGLGNYQYSLLDSASAVITGPQAGGTFAGLPAGDYYVHVVSGDCNFTSAVINVTEPLPLVVTPVVQNILCFELANGSITINTTGGTGIVQYAISPNLNQFVDTNVFSPLDAGNYDVVVQDQNGCFELLHLTVTKPTEIQASIVNVTDEACLGASDGTIFVTISGGTGTYEISTDDITYLPVTGTTHTLTGLPAGLTTVYVKDQNGCSLNPPMDQPILAGVDMDPQAAVTTTCVANAPNNDVTITILPGVDTNNVTYSIDGTNYQVSNVFTNVGLAPGTYTAYARHIVPVTNLTCIQTTPFTIDVHTAIAATASITQTIDCYGDQGEITIDVTAGTGTAPFEYAIGPGFVFGTSNVFSGLPTGTYDFKVRDDINCEFDITGVVLGQPLAPLTATETHTHEICITDADGSITVTPADGTAPYEVSIDGGTTYTTPSAAPAVFTALSPGNYTVDVRDANGCTYTMPASITIDPGVDFQDVPEVLPSCNNNVIGNIVFINVNPNIVAGVTYSFDGGPFGPDNYVQDATPGLHNYEVQHTNGCIKPGTFTVPTLLPISASVTATTNINCFGDATGSITVTATDGTGTLSYAIADSNVLPLAFGPYQPTGVFNGLAFGDYTISIMDDNVGCETQVTATLTQPAAALSATATSTDEICLGANDGTITVTPTNGTSPYEVRINGGAYTAPSAAPAVFTALAPGNYTVDVRDANGCTYTIPAAITIAPGVDLQATLSSNQVCDVTTITVSVNPALAAQITYSLDGGVGQASNTFVATGLTAGAHTIDVTHSNGCNATLSFNVAPVIPIVMGATATTPALCFGEATGTASVTATGGTAPLTYAISPDVTPRVYGPYQASNMFTGLASGSYVINVKDALGCESESAIIVVGQPTAALSATATTVTAEICLGANDGTITITPTNGTAPYEVRINGGAYTAPSATAAVFTALAPGSYTVDVRDANGCTYTIPAAITIAPGVDLQASIADTQVCEVSTIVVSVNPALAGAVTYYLDGVAQPSATITASNLTAGAHTIDVTHSNGCNATFNFTVAPVIPIVMGATATTPALCFGEATGTASVTATGGTAPLTYAISQDVTPRVYGPYQASNMFTGLASGSYVINVKDALGCESESAIIVVGQPTAALSATATTVTAEICLGANDGTITVTPTNGTAPYEVRINGGAYTAPSATAAVFTALAPGSYTVDVRDANGCTYTIPAAITIAPGVDLQASIADTQVCEVSTIVVSVNPALAGAVTYYLDGVAQPSATITASNLTAGAHTIDVTHSNGCNAAFNFTVAPVIPIVMGATATTPALCFGEATGTASVTATGGTAPLTYAISPDVTPRVYGPYQASNMFTGLATGSYVINVKDALGCESESAIIVVGQPTAALSATATTVTAEICLGANDGTITITPTNGTAPYEVRINGGAYTAPSATAAVFTALAPGSYTVDVRDANGCTYTIPAAITIAPGVDLQASIADTQVCEVSTIVVSVNPALAGAVTYYLDGVAQPSATITASNLTAGAHTIDVTHSNGCNATFNFTVAPVIPIVMGATATTPALCFGEATGTASVTATGGTAPLTYAISPDVTPRVYGPYQASNMFTGLASGSYVINVKDALGCESESAIIVVGQPTAALSATATTVTAEICLGANDGTITITPTNGTAPYEVRINGGAYTAPSATAAVFTALAPGSYTVDVRDANGCTYTIPAAITIAPGVDLQASIADTQVCEVSTIVVSVNPALAGAVTYYLDGVAQPSATITASNLTAGTHTIDVTHSNGCNATFNFTVAPVIPIVMGATSSTPVLCFGDGSGSATVTATGGTAPLTYAIAPNVTPLVYGPYQASNTFTGLTVGQYIINVKDALGCELATAPITVMGPNAALTAPTPVKTNETCIGANDGTITVAPTAGSGTAPYEVSIDGGTTYSAPSAGPFVFNNLAPNTYNVVIRDANGCTYTVPAAITITPGVNIQATVNATQVCDQVTVVVNVNAAVVGQVTYSLDGGAQQTSNTFVAVLNPAQPHSVTVTHVNGCAQTVPVPVTATIPIQFTVNDVITTDIACHGKDVGAITANATGGTPPLQYAITWDIWPNPIYSSSNVFTDLLADENPAEGYKVWVKDAMGCVVTVDHILIFEPDEELIIAANNIVHESCINAHDGSFSVNITGGTPPYSVALDSANNFVPYDPAASPTFANLYGRTLPYDVYVRDANGCYAKTTVVIEKGVNLVPGINTVLSCVNNAPVNTVTATLNTIVNNVTYKLETAAGVLIQNFSTVKTWNLAAGDYIYTVRHANGCEKEFPFTVQPRLNVSIDNVTPTLASCNGGSDGTITVTASGGTGDLTYGISPDFVMTDNNVFTGLPAGNYTIRVEDQYGCFVESTTTYQVGEPTIITMTPTVSQEVCVDDNNGSIEAAFAGGTPPYWSSLDANGTFEEGNTAIFDNLDGGVTYTIYVRDSNGCITTFDVPLDAPTDINATADIVYNCELNTVTIVTDSSINPGDLTYAIIAGPKGNNPPQTSNVFANLEDGTYTVEVVHTVLGCSDTAEFTIQSVPDLAISLSVSGLNQITATVAGGAPSYTYTFDGTDVGSKNTFVYYRSGIYEVTVTDSRGCTKVATIEVKFIDIILPDVTTPDGDGQNDTWSPGNTTNYPNINSDIFDRYGRKLATLRQGEVWDGTYEGNAMPTGDYWFLVKLGDAEDRSFVGHFTIYR